MTPFIRHSVLYNRVVLSGASLLFLAIAMRNIIDPVGASTPHHIMLGAGEAVTIMRVTGGSFLAFAIMLVGCIFAERRILVGAAFLTVFAAVLTAVRVLGIVLDGPAAFSMHVLKPEILITTLAGLGLYLESRRLRARRLPVGRAFAGEHRAIASS